MVPRGLEPRTLRLLAVRSNQLSYETTGRNKNRFKLRVLYGGDMKTTQNCSLFFALHAGTNFRFCFYVLCRCKKHWGPPRLDHWDATRKGLILLQ